MQEGQFTIIWNDLGAEPQCAPDKAFPAGRDMDMSRGAAEVCSTPLPYPAKRCGHFHVTCKLCEWNGIISTAGRPDDPRSLKMPCQRKLRPHPVVTQ